MSEFDNLLAEAIGELKKKGHWLESGEINLEGKLWSYKFRMLTKKPKADKMENP